MPICLPTHAMAAPRVSFSRSSTDHATTASVTRSLSAWCPHFLEAGFDTFRAMRGAASFLAMIGQRERALKDGLFAADTVACVTAASRSSDGPLGQLP